MNDLISRKALIEKLNLTKIKINCTKLHEILFFDGIMAIVDNQPEINEWIPVSERLPEISGYYLVTYHTWSEGNYLPKFNDTYVRRLHYQNSEKFVGWNYPICCDKKAEEDEHKNVLAWQQLPKKYKEVTK